MNRPSAEKEPQLSLNFSSEMSDLQKALHCLFHCKVIAQFFLLFILFFSLFGLLLINLNELSSLTILLASALFVISFVMLVLASNTIWNNYIKPINELEYWGQRIRSGDLKYKMPVPKSGELAHVTEDLNDLGTMMYHLALDTDKQLQQHTEYTEQKTQSLSILYDIAASINTSIDLNDLLRRFLHTLTQILDAKAGAVRLLNNQNQMELVASIGFDKELIKKEKILPAESCICGITETNDKLIFQDSLLPCGKRVGHEFFDDNVGLLVVPLQYQSKTLGVYNLFVKENFQSKHQDYIELFTSIGKHLGMAIAKARLDEESNKLSIMQERNRISYELHDSLAQTLASIRLQVRVLDEVLHSEDEKTIWQQLEKIESTVDEANTELRSLIGHFQAPIRKQALAPAIQNIVKRFRAESDIHIFFQSTIKKELHLADEKHLEVCRIVQEALNNIRKHSQANVARIMVQLKSPNILHMIIEDDGVGLPEHFESTKPGEKIGLTSMNDRAKRMNAAFSIDSEPGEGTQIILDVDLNTPNETQSVNIDSNFQLS